MAAVYVKSISSGKWLQIHQNEISDRLLTYDFIKERLFDWECVSSSDINVKVFHGSQEVRPGCPLNLSSQDVFLNTSISLVGGKGGFGSMLRAIGAQIEKTTNREACRDLSGRRLRDINEEKRLKDWVAKQAERQQEQEERKQKKLEKLKQEFRHEFHDPEYNKERAEVTDKVHEAIEQGMKAACSSEPAPKKRKSDGPALKKTALWVGVSDDETDSDDSDTEGNKPSTSKEETNSNSNELILPETMETSKQAEQSEESTSSTEIEAEKTIPHAEASKLETEDAPKGSVQSPIEPVTEHSEMLEKNEPAQLSAKESKPVKEAISYLPIVLEDYNSPDELEALGLDHLKEELLRRGLKCGGTGTQRAQRLFSVKGLKPEEIPSSLLAKPSKKN